MRWRKSVADRRLRHHPVGLVPAADVINPPMTALAIGARASAPAPMASARGSIPKIIATVVMLHILRDVAHREPGRTPAPDLRLLLQLPPLDLLRPDTGA